MINTNKTNNYQVPGTPLKQLFGKSNVVQVPQYSQIKYAQQNADGSRFQDYMLFQSAAVRLRLRLQRLFISYPFIKTSSNSSTNFFSFTAMSQQIQNYFNYIQNCSVFQKYIIQYSKTQNISLTSNQGDIIVVPYFDLLNPQSQRRFQNNITRLGELVGNFDNGIITKPFWGVQAETEGIVINNNQSFQFTDRDKTYHNRVPSQYNQSINRRGQIFNLLPSVYYRDDVQFQSLLNIFRQNYDKVWYKNKAVKNINKISYDKNQMQYLGGFVKQALLNNGINYFDINPQSITNIISYNYAPSNINYQNINYIPIGFSYRFLSDQFAYRMFTQKNLLIRAKGTKQPLERLVNMYGLRNRATGDFSRNPTWNDITDFQAYHNIDRLFNRNISGTGSFIDLQTTMDDQVFNAIVNGL